MQLKLRVYLSAIYWVVGIALILWCYLLVRQSKSEEALAPTWLLIFMTAPVSFVVEYLASLIGQLLQVEGKQNLFGSIVALAMLFAGYLQWFYLFPWLFHKIRSFF